MFLQFVNFNRNSFKINELSDSKSHMASHFHARKQQSVDCRYFKYYLIAGFFF